MDHEPDRPRGMLSQADREYLLGLSDMAHEQSKRNAEARIRKRVTNTVVDFYVLINTLKRKDRRQVFDKGLDDERFRAGLTGAMAFFYMGLTESGLDFESILEPAVRRAEEVYAAEGLDSTVSVDVTFDVNVETDSDLEDVAARVERGEAVTPGEFFSMVAGDGTPLDDVDAVVLQLGVGELGLDEEAFVARAAEFLDGDLEWVADDRVRIHTD